MKRFFLLAMVFENKKAMMASAKRRSDPRENKHNLLNNKTASISFKHLEQLCLLLGCSPNELLTWHNTDKTNVLPNHSLQSLKKERSKGNINQTLQQLPVSKLTELRNFLDNLSQTSTPKV